MDSIGKALPAVAMWIAVAIIFATLFNSCSFSPELPEGVNPTDFKCPDGYKPYFYQTSSSVLLECQETDDE